MSQTESDATGWSVRQIVIEPKCRSRPMEQWCDYDPKTKTVHTGGFMGHTCARVIDPGAEPSAPKGSLAWIIAYVMRHPFCTLAGGEAAILVKEIERLTTLGKRFEKWVKKHGDRQRHHNDRQQVWCLIFKRDGEADVHVEFGTQAAMTARYDALDPNWSDIVLSHVKRGPRELQHDVSITP
jgi:hypothetical protein